MSTPFTETAQRSASAWRRTGRERHSNRPSPKTENVSGVSHSGGPSLSDVSA